MSTLSPAGEARPNMYAMGTCVFSILYRSHFRPHDVWCPTPSAQPGVRRTAKFISTVGNNTDLKIENIPTQYVLYCIDDISATELSARCPVVYKRQLTELWKRYCVRRGSIHCGEHIVRTGSRHLRIICIRFVCKVYRFARTLCILRISPYSHHQCAVAITIRRDRVNHGRAIN